MKTNLFLLIILLFTAVNAQAHGAGIGPILHAMEHGWLALIALPLLVHLVVVLLRHSKSGLR